MKRFIIQESEKQKDHFVVTDTENRLVIIFKKGALNETQKITELKTVKISQVSKISNTMMEVGKWLARYHKDKI